jgi:hypothetical protein
MRSGPTRINLPKPLPPLRPDIPWNTASITVPFERARKNSNRNPSGSPVRVNLVTLPAYYDCGEEMVGAPSAADEGRLGQVGRQRRGPGGIRSCGYKSKTLASLGKNRAILNGQDGGNQFVRPGNRIQGIRNQRRKGPTPIRSPQAWHSRSSKSSDRGRVLILMTFSSKNPNRIIFFIMFSSFYEDFRTFSMELRIF